MTIRGYELSKAVFEGKVSRDKALDELEYNYGMNRGSASDYIQGFKYMMIGEGYKRTFNSEATDYFLQNIYIDFGSQNLGLALKSVKKHIDYYYEIRKVNLNSINRIYEKYNKIIKNTDLMNGDELDISGEYLEGQKKTILVNAFERNTEARLKCISHYGMDCGVCKFNFREFYGQIGEGFIHVHHLKLISSIGLEYKIDPIGDLLPVCPNCHAMLHKRSPPYTVEELKEMIRIKK